MIKISCLKFIYRFLSGIAFVAILASCASEPTHDGSDSDKTESLKASTVLPRWVTSPNERCTPNELCASSEGRSVQDSDAKARAEIASIFKTQVRSKLQSYSRMETESMFGGQYNQAMSQALDQETEGVLKGTIISERFDYQGRYFSYAKLDRRVAVGDLRSKIKDLDDRIVSLYGLKSRSVYTKLKKLYRERRGLEPLMLVLTGTVSSTPLALRDIEDLKNSKAVTKSRIRLNISGTSDVKPAALNAVKNHIESLLAQAGHVVVTTPNSTVDYLLKIGVEAKSEYMKVQGFEKWTYGIKLSSFRSKDDKKLGGILMSQTGVGRDQQDAFLKIRPVVKQKLEDQIADLRLP